MTRTAHTMFLMLGSALALAGCGIQGFAPAQVKDGAGSAAQSASRFFPADQAAVWQYEVSIHPTDDPDVTYKGTETVTVETIRRSGDKTVMKLRAIDEFTARYRFPVVTESPDGVSISGVTYWGSLAREAEGHSLQFLNFPLVNGARWDDGLWIGKAVRKETVHVPAGTFEAWNIDVIGTYDQAYTAVGHYWVAPGKGIVKSELSIPGWSMESVMIPAGRAKQVKPGQKPLLPLTK